jgi:hypothetical protein
MFQFSNNKIVLDPNVLSLPFFKVIWEADKTKSKEDAVKSLSYIFYLVDNKSPYAGYPQEKRRENIIKDYIKEPKWKESKDILEAIEKYKQYNTTLSSELLEAVKGQLYKLKSYYESVTFDLSKDADIELEMKKVDSIQKSMGNIGKLLESLTALEERVKKEITQKSTVRGGQALGLYSE